MQRSMIAGGLMTFTVVAVLAASWQAHGENAGGQSISEIYQSSYELEAKNDNSGALLKAREILRREPDDYVAQLRVGWLLYVNKRYQDSAEAYRTAVKLAPRAVEPKLGLMLPLMATRRHQEALKVSSSILTIDPGNFLARSRKAYLLYQLGRYAKAEREYREVLALYPANVEMMAGLGWALVKQGKRTDARDVFAGLLRVAPQHSSGKAGMSKCQ